VRTIPTRRHRSFRTMRRAIHEPGFYILPALNMTPGRSKEEGSPIPPRTWRDVARDRRESWCMTLAAEREFWQIICYRISFRFPECVSCCVHFGACCGWDDALLGAGVCGCADGTFRGDVSRLRILGTGAPSPLIAPWHTWSSSFWIDFRAA
jgi:hypothetical protein